ncbi:hypothetical protein [Sphingobium sp.]|uniref:hypothetical protein n=1 Tax=Sphingobium sp. TaxID=1912891 RepID=UPI002B57D7C1|nr:hypothetical protein [Sphingobium sp.]HUD92233.1 hypothetical protein [Sphingobium sp.]
MIGKIVGALAGKKLAGRTPGMSATGGLVLGAAATSLLKRVGPFGLAAALVGSYLIKRNHVRKAGAGRVSIAR